MHADKATMHLHTCILFIIIYLQVAELASLAQLLPPCSPTVRNPVPDSSLCRAAAPRLRLLQLLLPARLPRSASISAELPSCIRFSCCSPRDCLDLLQFLLSSRLASASAAARRLRPLQLLLSIASVSTASRLHPLWLLGCCSPPAVLEDSSHVHYSRTLYAELAVK